MWWQLFSLLLSPDERTPVQICAISGLVIYYFYTCKSLVVREKKKCDFFLPLKVVPLKERKRWRAKFNCDFFTKKKKEEGGKQRETSSSP